jgi:5-methylcytosine-specific restriction endonuclease McrA
MRQMPYEQSPENWGNWYLAPNLKIKHKRDSHITLDIDELTNTADILKSVFLLLHLNSKSYGCISVVDAACMLFAVKEVLKFNGVNFRTNAQFDGYKCARNYYKHVVNKRNVPNSLRLSIFERDKFKCVYCGLGAKDGAVLNVDHILPVSKGGSNEPDNLQTLCRACNNGKSDRIMPDDAPAPSVRHA